MRRQKNRLIVTKERGEKVITLVICRRCSLKWLLSNNQEPVLELAKDPQYYCPACGSNRLEPVKDDLADK